MITKLYSFYNTPFDHDVCHLFEHLVLWSFLLKLASNGYNRAFFGWLRGNTIDSTIFFDLGAYSDEIAQLFDGHVRNLNTFTTDLISQSLAHIEAEMACTVEIVNESLLRQQLEQLSRVARDEKVDVVVQGSPLKITDAPDLFEEIAIAVNVFSASEKVRKAFLGLHPAILDIVRDAVIDNEAVYPTGTSALAINYDGIGIAWRFMTKKGIDVKVLEHVTTQYVKELDVAECTRHIDLYQDNIIHDASYSAKLIQFYEQTDIQSTREELAELATSSYMADIMSNMTIRFLPIEGKLKELEWDY